MGALPFPLSCARDDARMALARAIDGIQGGRFHGLYSVNIDYKTMGYGYSELTQLCGS
jgi:hypothetical protein